VLHEWYLLACSKNIYPVGLQLCEKAKQIAERLQKPEFKASNGWLQKPASSYIESEDEPEIEPSPPKLRNLGEAVRNLEDVQEFLDSKGYISKPTAIACVINTVGTLQFKVSHQSTLD